MVYINEPTADALPNEILAMVFSYLEVPELLSCDMVCRRWRSIVSNLNWKNLLEQMIHLYPSWQRMSYTFRRTANQSKINHKFECHEIYRNIQRSDSDWRSRRFFNHIDEIHCRITYFFMDGDYVAVKVPCNLVYDRCIAHVLDRRTGKSLHKIGMAAISTSYPILQKNHILLEDSDFLAIFDARTGKKVFQFYKPEESTYYAAFNAGILAVSFRLGYDGSLLRLWKRVAFDQFEFICQHTFEHRVLKLHIDDHYIAVCEGKPSPDGKYVVGLFNVHFVSTKNFSVEQGPLVFDRNHVFYYNQGIFFAIQPEIGMLKLIEVSTKKLLRSIHYEAEPPSRMCRYSFVPVRVDSKYLVTFNTFSKVCVYDFIAAKDPSADSNNLLLATLRFPTLWPWHFELNDREIRAVGSNLVFPMEIMSLDFKTKIGKL